MMDSSKTLTMSSILSDMNLKKNSMKQKSKEKPSKPANQSKNRPWWTMERRNQSLLLLFINQMEVKWKRDWKRLMMVREILREKSLLMENHINNSKTNLFNFIINE